MTDAALFDIEPDLDKSWAVESDDKKYRYQLGRRWGPGPLVAFVMLNPSTANGIEDDPTIRRCCGFARSWGYNGIVVVNRCAYRATNPRDLLYLDEEVRFGPDNETWLESVAESPLIIAAWGSSPGRRGPGSDHRVSYFDRLQCLGVNKDGEPKHPLYVHGDTKPSPWPKDRRAFA